MHPRPFLGLFLPFFTACAATEAPVQSVPSSESTTERSEEPIPQARRMTPEEIEALPAVEDSVCREFASETPRTLNRCEFLGPYPGEIAPPAPSSQRLELEEALLACHSDITCMGVSTDWYTGSQWYTVAQTSRFSPDTNSYGCSFVIRCP